MKYPLFILVLFSFLPSVCRAADDYDLLDEAIEAELAGIDFTCVDVEGDEPICGEPVVSDSIMAAFVIRHNKDFDREIARAYIELGALYGIRGDMAFCQAVLETGWFKYDKGTAVTQDAHNYCGLGVLQKGRGGAVFASVQDGVRAHLQHLYAYMCDDALPEGEELIDPRFTAVRRGSAATWIALNRRWAMNDAYGQMIIKIYKALVNGRS